MDAPGALFELIPVEWRRRKFIVTSPRNSERVDQWTIYVLELNSMAVEKEREVLCDTDPTDTTWTWSLGKILLFLFGRLKFKSLKFTNIGMEQQTLSAGVAQRHNSIKTPPQRATQSICQFTNHVQRIFNFICPQMWKVQGI